MATYSDGTTEAMVGDVVETKDQSALLPTGCYRVVLVNGPFHVKLGAITASEHLNTDCGIWLSDRFTLIQRDGNLISRKQEPPMSEPLVKWPEIFLAWTDLQPSEWFVFDCEEWRDIPCARLKEGFVSPFKILRSDDPVLRADCMATPVRRLRMTQPPKFEVI